MVNMQPIAVFYLFAGIYIICLLGLAIMYLHSRRMGFDKRARTARRIVGIGVIALASFIILIGSLFGGWIFGLIGIIVFIPDVYRIPADDQGKHELVYCSLCFSFTGALLVIDSSINQGQGFNWQINIMIGFFVISAISLIVIQMRRELGAYS